MIDHLLGKSNLFFYNNGKTKPTDEFDMISYRD